MFELSVALKYLLPRWRQLSVSIISLISILVISLVVWLIVVFLSVTHGLEKIWTQKLIALTAPIRITPTENYYHSYYYLVDGISADSDFTHKTIREKLQAAASDPYNPEEDEEIPALWLTADRNAAGALNDPVKKAYAALQNLKHVPGLRVKDYELTAGNLQLHLVRNAAQVAPQMVLLPDETNHVHSSLSQVAWLGSFDPHQVNLLQALLPIDSKDLTNVLEMSDFASGKKGEQSDEFLLADAQTVRQRLHAFFDKVAIRSLKTPANGWVIPRHLFSANETYAVHAEMVKGKPTHIWISGGAESLPASNDQGQLRVDDKNHFYLKLAHEATEMQVAASTPILLNGDFAFPAQLAASSLEKAAKSSDLLFEAEFKVQGKVWKGLIPFQNLKIDEADFSSVYSKTPSEVPEWLFVTTEQKSKTLNLPAFANKGEGVLLPKSFKEAGVLIGDSGHLSYMSPTASSVQEQLIPIFVAGFYDPGIIPIGGKLILISQETTSLIRSAQNEQVLSSNGINVNFERLHEAPQIKASIQKAFDEAGIASYWKIETFREFEFTRDLIQQLGTERTLWSLIATVIIIVACSNIISMLIILVNDKKVEIGILRSMGASSLSIASIFGFCGVVMGITGSVLGVVIAWVTLHNLQMLVNLISQFQGYEAFNPVFFGNALPNQMSMEALLFVFITTIIISLLAGIVPAVKASMLRPSAILRSE